MFGRVLIYTVILVLGSSHAAQAQSAPKFPATNVTNDKRAGQAPDDPEQQSPYREMVKEMEIKREATHYKEHVARAKENAQLAVELRDAFARQKTFHAAELKKLSLMEKLSRKIRNNAGGEDNKEESETPTLRMEEALERLAEISSELQKKVETTPRQVVSAAVIKCANEVVELVKYIRTFYR